MSDRKIVHIDMDAFYASVEQRDDPSLRGKPLAVAWRGGRSVVCAASYEARKFGVKSAMPASQAERRCPDLIFVPPDFAKYRAASTQVREIFSRHTDLIEPLSLDEAYLDLTRNKLGIKTANEVAKMIRNSIREELQLTASAGIAPNKFLAKIASDWRKPDGQFTIMPHEVEAFLEPLSVRKIWGVGKVMHAKLAEIGIETVGQLRVLKATELEGRFGKYGIRLFELARGIDETPVVANRPTQSISAEDTFQTDLRMDELENAIRDLSGRVWKSAEKISRTARTVVLKLKTADFKLLTRSMTPPSPPQSCEALTRIALSLRVRVELEPATRYRLIGVGLSNFRDPEEETQPDLFGPTGTPTGHRVRHETIETGR